MKNSASLKVPDFVRPIIEKIVQKRSKIETYSNVLYTLLLQTRFDSGKAFTPYFLTQSCTGACMRAVCSRVPDQSPKEVKYIDHEVQKCSRDAELSLDSDEISDGSAIVIQLRQAAVNHSKNLNHSAKPPNAKTLVTATFACSI
jgi:hypothetical protein